MSEKKDDVFAIAGVSEQDVRKWQKENKFEGVRDKALVQLYAKAVLKKTLRQPYPVLTIKQIWEDINAINSGQKPSTNRKMFVGIKDARVIGLLRSITYVGCPECLKGAKKIGASKCAGHGTTLVDLKELSWNEWLVDDNTSEFTIKMSPKYMNEYNELNMTGGEIYVEGVIDLDQDPIMMMVTGVRTFEPGKIMMGAGYETDEEGDDYTVGRDDVDFEGFEDEEVVETLHEKSNPFADENDVETEEPKNGISSEFKEELKKEFKDAMNLWAIDPVKRIQVEKFMLDWIEERYPMEFSDEKEAIKKLWEVVEGLYKDVGNDRIQRLD